MFSKEKFHGSEIDIFEQVMMCVSYLLNLTSQRTVNIKKIMLLRWRERKTKQIKIVDFLSVLTKISVIRMS